MSRLVLAFLFVALLWPGTSRATEPLVPVRTVALGTSAAATERVLVVGGQPVLVGAGQGRVLAGDAWSPAQPFPEGEVLAAVADGARTLALVRQRSGPELFILTLAGNRVESRAWGGVPFDVQSPNLAVLGGRLYLAGNAADGSVIVRHAALAASSPAWQTTPPPPTAGRVTSLVMQEQALFLTVQPGNRTETEVWRWSAVDGWLSRGTVAGQIRPGGARAAGQAHLLYLASEAERSAPRLLSYHTLSAAVAVLQELPGEWRGGGAAWRDGLLWLAADGATELRVQSTELVARQLLLHGLDWIVIVVYLTGMSGIGLYFYLREKRDSTADFFVGARTIPFWAAGISLYATNTSSISYIAIPAKSFATNWQYLTNNLVAVMGLTFVAVFIVPLLRRLDLMSVFHYLEIRFHPAIRSLTSALCIAMQLGGRMSVVLFLPSLAISTITGLNVVWSILIMGGITILYTTLGGMKAVIWTDVVQLFVMFGGALFAIGFIVFKLDGGFGEFFSAARAEDKMKLFDWSFDLTKATVWGFIFLVLFDVVLTFPKDQVLMQRVLSTKDSRAAGRSVWTFAAIMVPGGFLFYLIGTALYVFYKTHPERMNPLLATDATFPLFIAAELPVGVTGLIIAGIFAASMSTLSSIMNSVATLASVDFYERFKGKSDKAASVRFAEWMTVAAGLIGMGLAFLLSRYDINSLFDLSIELSGLLGGGFAGAYTLGMFTRRANWQGVAIGIATSIVLTMTAWSQNLVHPYFYLAISILICIVVGYAASLFFPAPAPATLRGLTILRENSDAVAGC